MTETIISKPGFIALRMHGHVSRDDIDRCYALLEDAFASGGTVDVYVEVDGLTGVDTEALGPATKHGWALLDSLDRIGRVAIVSDESWVLWASRIESALLPGISYRTYRLAERAEALDWVEHRSDLPYGQAIRLIPTTRPDVLGIEIDGRLAAEEVGTFAQTLNRMRRERPVKAILLRFRSLEGFDPTLVANGEYLRMKLGLLGELDRYAIVGGPEWLTRTVELLRPLLRFELRRFEAGEESDAWDWLGAQPLDREPPAANPLTA